MAHNNTHPLFGKYVGKPAQQVTSKGEPVPNNSTVQVVTINPKGKLTLELDLDWTQATLTDKGNMTLFFRQDTLSDATVTIEGKEYQLHIRSFIGLWQAPKPKPKTAQQPTRKLTRIQF